MEALQVQRLHCPVCGVFAACDCGVAPVRRAENAIAANPEKSARAIAEEFGMGHATVSRARKKRTVSGETVGKLIGRDGKKRKSPKPKKPNLRIVHTSADPITEGCPDCSTQEEEWQRSVMNLASDAISLPAYWSRQFGEDWKTFAVTSQLAALAKQAAEEWTKLASAFATRQRKDARR